MKKNVLKMVAAVFALSMLLGTTCFAREFDASFYAKTYPDVVNALGSDATVLYNHYLTSGQSEGRLPYEGASKGEAVEAPNPNATVETPQPVAKKTYDLRDLKTLVNEQGFAIKPQWVPILQKKFNELINDPSSHINGRTAITDYKFSQRETYDAVELWLGDDILIDTVIRGADILYGEYAEIMVDDYTEGALYYLKFYLHSDGRVSHVSSQYF